MACEDRLAAARSQERKERARRVGATGSRGDAGDDRRGRRILRQIEHDERRGLARVGAVHDGYARTTLLGEREHAGHVAAEDQVQLDVIPDAERLQLGAVPI